MPTDEGAAYYSGLKRASVAMSNADKEAGIRKFHLELARCYADLAGVSASQIDSLQRQTALDVTVVSGSVVVSSATGEATFLTRSAACLTSDRSLARARGAAAEASAPRNSP
jgi:hypothetical protein